MLDQLRESGFVHLTDTSLIPVDEVTNFLGEVIQTTEIRLEPQKRGILPSARSIGFHTDHFRADFIVWQCLQPAEVGGDTVLIDAEAALSGLTSNVQAALSSAPFHENRVFDEDPESYPFLTYPKGIRKIYFSFWPCDEEMSAYQHQALEEFNESVKAQTPIKLSLKTHEILVVDNGRMLHGRTAITGKKQRLLRRYWVKKKSLK